MSTLTPMNTSHKQQLKQQEQQSRPWLYLHSKNKVCGTQNEWAHHETTHIWLEHKRKVCWTKKLQAKGKKHAPKL